MKRLFIGMVMIGMLTGCATPFHVGIEDAAKESLAKSGTPGGLKSQYLITNAVQTGLSDIKPMDEDAFFQQKKTKKSEAPEGAKEDKPKPKPKKKSESKDSQWSGLNDSMNQVVGFFDRSQASLSLSGFHEYRQDVDLKGLASTLEFRKFFSRRSRFGLFGIAEGSFGQTETSDTTMRDVDFDYMRFGGGLMFRMDNRALFGLFRFTNTFFEAGYNFEQRRVDVDPTSSIQAYSSSQHDHELFGAVQSYLWTEKQMPFLHGIFLRAEGGWSFANDKDSTSLDAGFRDPIENVNWARGRIGFISNPLYRFGKQKLRVHLQGELKYQREFNQEKDAMWLKLGLALQINFMEISFQYQRRIFDFEEKQEQLIATIVIWHHKW